MLPSIGNEIVKAAVAQYNAEQLLTQRDRVSRAVSMCLSIKHGQLAIDCCHMHQFTSLYCWCKSHSCLQIRDSLTKRAREFNILVDDVAITHLSFGAEVRAAGSAVP